MNSLTGDDQVEQDAEEEDYDSDDTLARRRGDARSALAFLGSESEGRLYLPYYSLVTSFAGNARSGTAGPRVEGDSDLEGD